MTLEEFINKCIDDGRWPPALRDLPQEITLDTPIIQAMQGSLMSSAREKGVEKGFGVNFDNDTNKLIPGPEVSGSCASIRIPASGNGTQVPVGVFHTHFMGADEGIFQGIENPPSMADMLNMLQPGTYFSLVIAGKIMKPVYFLMISTTEYKTVATELVSYPGKQGLEWASENYIKEKHKDLVNSQGVEIRKAMKLAVRTDFRLSVAMLQFGAYRGKTQALQRVSV